MKRAIMVFTLVELLITISVIAILVGMLLPALNKAKSAASRIACSGNLRQIGISLTIYTQQNNDLFRSICRDAKPEILHHFFPERIRREVIRKGWIKKRGSKVFFSVPALRFWKTRHTIGAVTVPHAELPTQIFPVRGGCIIFGMGAGRFRLES